MIKLSEVLDLSSALNSLVSAGGSQLDRADFIARMTPGLSELMERIDKHQVLLVNSKAQEGCVVYKEFPTELGDLIDRTFCELTLHSRIIMWATLIAEMLEAAETKLRQLETKSFIKNSGVGGALAYITKIAKEKPVNPNNN